MIRLLFLIFCFSFVAGSCGNPTITVVEAPRDSAPPLVAATGLEVQPQLLQADSVQILYFTKPFTDKKRYTRFYSVFSGSDTAFINAVVQNFNQSFVVKNELDSCLSEGKLFLYSGGQPVKTIYFATDCADCCHLYFIKDGQFYYFDVPPALSAALNEKKKSAKTPAAATVIAD